MERDMTKIRYYHGHCGQPCTEPELKRRSGMQVRIVRELTPAEVDVAEVGLMYRVRFLSGFEVDAFIDELETVEDYQ